MVQAETPTTADTKQPQPLPRLRFFAALFQPNLHCAKLHFLDAFHKRFQLAAAAGMTQLAQRLGFDLADALAGYLEALADFFQRVLGAVFQAETHLDDTLFARSKRTQNLRRVLLEVDADDGFRRRYGLAIFNEVTEVRIFL